MHCSLADALAFWARTAVAVALMTFHTAIPPALPPSSLGALYKV